MKLDADVRSVLEAATVEGTRLHLRGQLDRKLYVRVAKALELMGGKWNRREAAHIFEDRAEDVVADAVATGAVVDFRKEFQFFETPTNIARLLVAEAYLQQGQSILEPSAGRGSIVGVIRDRGFEPEACELWEANRKVLVGRGVLLIADDFLSLTAAKWDRIIANPPFSRQQDVIHVTHMWSLLRPGGRLVSVMSPGWTFRQDRRATEFRNLVEEHEGRWRMLPDGSFKESGTAVSVGFLVLDRP
jgi:hypothetical protein